jgi:hypothetical protein
MPQAPAASSYAHVNVWRLNDEGASWEDTTAREVAAALRRQPGFRAYTVVRTAEWEVVVVTVFESQAQLDAAMEAIAPLVRDTVQLLVTGAPDRREGAVLMHVAA